MMMKDFFCMYSRLRQMTNAPRVPLTVLWPGRKTQVLVHIYIYINIERERVLLNVSGARVWANGGWCCRSATLSTGFRYIYKVWSIYRPSDEIVLFMICENILIVLTGWSKLPSCQTTTPTYSTTPPVSPENNSVFGSPFCEIFLLTWAVSNISFGVNDDLLSVKTN